MSINRWMDKEDVVRIYNGILKQKNEWNNAICNSMDGPGDYHTKWSKRNTDIIWYHFYVESKAEILTGRDKLGDWDWHINTTIYKIDN